ncbi:anti-sigma factor [Pseudochryseolinea flava]|uniref:Anti-sigma factor n=1 Tax=Pseudochryseolinea flava TaxID=2059302 RepID=A0A364Y4X1_9BACT|nr:hypothetical protein [Pseudochryseolinea flava]RAW00877.1 hypothetical protein DQQ10_11585 [Pseudochryseolinea flava]
MAVKSHPTEIYALIARYLAGEASPEDRRRIEQIFIDHPELKSEFEFFRFLLEKHDQRQAQVPFKNGFERITKRLKDEGLR